VGAVVITYPGGGTCSFDGFLTGWSVSVPIDDRMTASAEIKVTGAVTIA